MKKILAAMLSGILALSALSGCGTYTTDETSSSASTSNTDSSATGESEKPPPVKALLSPLSAAPCHTEPHPVPEH